MKVAGLLLATALALAIQTAAGRFLGNTIGVDLILVVVVYAALSSGPVTGLVMGTVAGIAQDALSAGNIIGVGGLAKTVVGFLAGVIGTQFIVAHPLPRFVAFFAASLLHAALFLGIYLLIGRQIGAPFTRLAAQGLGNAVIGLLVFKIAESLPGAEDARMRR